MNWFKKIFYKPESINEAQKPFKKMEVKGKEHGEGYENVSGFGQTGLSSFNLFYDKYINQQLVTEKAKLTEYRKMAEMPEIGDVLENAAIEGTQYNDKGKTLHLVIRDQELLKNENLVKNIEESFETLFYDRIMINNHIQDWFKSFMIDGKIYFENVINKSKSSAGVLNIKKLPTETIDLDMNIENGKVSRFYQFLTENAKKPDNVDDMEGEDVIIFYPSQITYIDSGQYGINKKDVIGYLHKCKQPFNQLKLLETSVVIYRLIRSPERLVFSIDTGSMPKDKSMKYVEKIKQKFTKKEVYDPDTGKMNNGTDVNSIIENYFLAQCLRLDTKIPLFNTYGRPKTLKELIDDFDNGIKNVVYSVDQQTGEFIGGEVEWAGITRKNANLIRVDFDNGRFLECTPDHKIVLLDGSEVEAQNLTEKDTLVSFSWGGSAKITKIEKLTFKEDTGCLTIKDPGNNHNFAISSGVFVKNSADGRGSSIESIGGNPSGFAELDDIYYFRNKLYLSLKYPTSRVDAMNEKQNNSVVYGTDSGNIARDEVRWAKIVQYYQNRMCEKFLDLFMLHLKFTGLKKELDIKQNQIQIEMFPPNNYLEEMQQTILQQKFENYSTLANNDEFAKTYLMRKYLGMDNDDLDLLKEGFEDDKKYLPTDDDGF